MPRAFIPRIKQRLTLGFVCTAPGGSLAVTSDDLQNLYAVPTVSSATVATATYKQLVTGYRLHRVSVWGSGVSGAFNNISLKWSEDTDSLGSLVGTTVTGTSFGVETPAYVSAVPPPNTAQYMWWDGSSPDEAVFTILVQGDTGADLFIEIDIELVFTVGVLTQAIVTTGFATSLNAIAVGNMVALPLNSTSGTTIATCAMPRGIPSSVLLSPAT